MRVRPGNLRRENSSITKPKLVAVTGRRLSLQYASTSGRRRVQTQALSNVQSGVERHGRGTWNLGKGSSITSSMYKSTRAWLGFRDVEVRYNHANQAPAMDESQTP